MLDREVKAWVDRHQDTLKKTLHEFLDDNNLMLTALATMRMHLNSDLITWTSDLAGQVAQRIRNGF